MFSASQRADALDGRDLARLVELPQAEEAAQLALEVAGRLAEVLEARGAPVDGVDLDERVDQLLADQAPLLGGVERVGDARDDHLALDPLHHVEGRADHARSAQTASTSGTRAGVSRSARSSRASRSTSWALGGSGGRGGRRSTTSSPPRSIR